MVAAGGVKIQIGGWTHTLWSADKWARLPEPSRLFVTNKTTTTVGSALGGLIYLRLPLGLSLGDISVTLDGA